MRSGVVILALLALVAGCEDGDSAPSDEVAAIVARAFRSGEGAGSYRLSLKVRSDIESELVEIKLKGVSSSDGSRGHWNGTVSMGGASPEGLELISTKRGPFLRGEFFGDELPAGRWLRLPDPRAARMGPSEFVEFLKAAGDIENVGTDQIRGEPSVHLEGPLDLEAVVKETGSEVARLFADQPVFEEMELELDAWISKHSGRINRMLLIGTHPEVEGTLEISGDFSAYGVSLEESKAPDPSTVLVR